MGKNVKDSQLNRYKQGNGPLTLVFLHYFGGSALEWRAVMDLLSDRYRCIALDLPGHGSSDVNSTTGYTVDDMARAVQDVVGTDNVTDFVLVGHSMSGKVALAIAAGSETLPRPAELRALLLVSPSPPVPEPIPDEDRQKLLAGHGKQSSAEETFRNITEASVPEKAKAQIIADNLRTAKPAWDAWLIAGSREDISDRMVSITIPVHIVVGSQDRALPPKVQSELVMPYLKNATLEIIDGAGHLLPWEIPHKLAAFITKKLTP